MSNKKPDLLRKAMQVCTKITYSDMTKSMCDYACEICSKPSVMFSCDNQAAYSHLCSECYEKQPKKMTWAMVPAALILHMIEGSDKTFKETISNRTRLSVKYS